MKKPELKQIIKEELKAILTEGEKITPKMLKAVQKALPELEKLIASKSKVKAKLQAKMDGSRISITSGSLISQVGPVGRVFLKDIEIHFWGGQIVGEGLKFTGNRIWFNPKVSYEHPGGGSNGADFIWDNLWFSFETNIWIEGRTIGK